MPTSSEDEAGKKSSRFFNQKEETKKEEQPAKAAASAKPGNVQQRVGLIETIMNENRQAQKKHKEAASASQGMDAMLDALKEVANGSLP